MSQLHRYATRIAAASVAGALAIFALYRHQCRDMNDAEMHCTLDVAMFASVARSAPRYGTGTGVKSLDWREHLLGSFTPLENARELLAIVGLRRSAHLTPDIATEATRRLLRYLNPFRAAEAADWSEAECRAIAASLLAQIGAATAEGGHSASGAERSAAAKDVVALAPSAAVVSCEPSVPLPTLMPWWLRLSNRVGNLVASWAVSSCGLRSSLIKCAQWRLHYYESAPAANSAAAAAPPMLLVHGMFTTAVSMGALGALLQAKRRVVILDLPDFDFGFSRTTLPAPRSGEPRPGSLAQHAAAVEFFAAKLAAESATGQVDLVGHSYGAHLVAIAARRLEGRVRHVHLLAPAGVGASTVIGPLNEPLRALDGLPSLARRAVAPLLLAVLRSPNALNFFVSMFRRGKLYWEGEPLGTQCRAHVVVGDWDQIVLPRPAAQMAQRFPGGEGWTIRGGRHQMILLSAATVVERIEAFAARGAASTPPSAPKGAQWLTLRERIVRLLLCATHSDVVPLFDNSAEASVESGAVFARASL